MATETERLRAERIALNEVAFRRANEIIRVRAEHVTEGGPIPFICECGDAKCFSQVELSLAEYESVRRSSTDFFVTPGHAITGPDLDRVVRAEERYCVVEKVGVSGGIAEARDPRRRGGEEAANDNA